MPTKSHARTQYEISQRRPHFGVKGIFCVGSQTCTPRKVARLIMPVRRAACGHDSVHLVVEQERLAAVGRLCPYRHGVPGHAYQVSPHTTVSAGLLSWLEYSM
jgi:hypothetical protein